MPACPSGRPRGARPNRGRQHGRYVRWRPFVRACARLGRWPGCPTDYNAVRSARAGRGDDRGDPGILRRQRHAGPVRWSGCATWRPARSPTAWASYNTASRSHLMHGPERVPPYSDRVGGTRRPMPWWSARRRRSPRRSGARPARVSRGAPPRLCSRGCRPGRLSPHRGL